MFIMVPVYACPVEGRIKTDRLIFGAIRNPNYAALPKQINPFFRHQVRAAVERRPPEKTVHHPNAETRSALPRSYRGEMKITRRRC